MLAALLLLATLVGGAADAAVQRFAVLAGSNDGASNSAPLYFAEDDVAKVQSVLSTLGGYDPEDLVVVTPANRRELIAAFGEVRFRVQTAQQAGDEVVFLFYYSGHATDDALLLSGTELSWDELDTMLENTGAEVKVALVDACQSGAMTRAKGGTRAPSFVFDVSERLGASGTVIITSSTRDEASQESDEIGGSYFTHYLVSGLSGTADRDGDAKITLAETYDYVYHETVIRTSTTRSGTQHPTFEWDLAGEGDLVLTELDPSRAWLSFPQDLIGTFAVFDVQRRMFVAEVDPAEGERRLALAPGRYQVQRRLPTHLQVAELRLGDGDRVDVADQDFEAVEYEDDLAKGDIEKRIRRAELPKSSVRLALGFLSTGPEEMRLEYFPVMGVAGASWRLAWREGRWLSVDLLAGGGGGDILPTPELPVETAVAVSSLGVAAGFSTRPADFQAGGGLRVDGIFLSRSFNGDQQLDPQTLLYPAPGLVGWAGWHPRQFELDLEYRWAFVPFKVDDREAGFVVATLLLTAGYRF